MPSAFFASLAVASGFAMVVAIVFTSLLSRRLPTLIQSFQWLGFIMVLSAGFGCVRLLEGDIGPGAHGQNLSLIVLLLTIGVAIYLESARQYKKISEISDQ